LWPLSRGLRPVRAYRSALAEADAGRLEDFVAWFIWSCSEQAAFMARLLEPSALLGRLDGFIASEAARGRMDQRAVRLVEVAFLRGAVPKSDAASLLGVTDRHARRLIEPLAESGLLVSDGRASPYRLAFPVGLAGVLFPGLFGGV